MANRPINRSWMKKKKNNSSSNKDKPLNKKQQKTYEASLKKGKEYTKSQLRFKKREAQGLSGLTGGKKGETIAEYRARQKKRIQDSAGEKNRAFQKYKKGEMSKEAFIKAYPNSNLAKKHNKLKLKKNTTKNNKSKDNKKDKKKWYEKIGTTGGFAG